MKRMGPIVVLAPVAVTVVSAQEVSEGTVQDAKAAEVVKTLEQRCSVIMFPEGTRSVDGRVGRFNDGAFHLAVKAGVPVLPVVVEGSHGCLPKKTWKFGPVDIRLEVLPPVPAGSDPIALRDSVRSAIIAKLAEWRRVSPVEVDGLR